jgi:hypothetical protein
LDEARTDGEQSETPADFRVSFESRRKPFEVLWKEAAEAVERERLARKGDLYFIRAGSAVKIGHTINIVNRLGKMQADNHEELDCILLLRGRGHEEPQWHKQFRHCHIRGEWFRWTDDLERAVLDARAANAGAQR